MVEVKDISRLKNGFWWHQQYTTYTGYVYQLRGKNEENNR